MMLIRGMPEEEGVNELYLLLAGAPVDHDLSHLSEDKQLQVREICNSEVFQENAWRTSIVKHDIVVEEGASVSFHHRFKPPVLHPGSSTHRPDQVPVSQSHSVDRAHGGSFL